MQKEERIWPFPFFNFFLLFCFSTVLIFMCGGGTRSGQQILYSSGKFLCKGHKGWLWGIRVLLIVTDRCAAPTFNFLLLLWAARSSCCRKRERTTSRAVEGRSLLLKAWQTNEIKSPVSPVPCSWHQWLREPRCKPCTCPGVPQWRCRTLASHSSSHTFSRAIRVSLHVPAQQHQQRLHSANVSPIWGRAAHHPNPPGLCIRCHEHAQPWCHWGLTPGRCSLDQDLNG